MKFANVLYNEGRVIVARSDDSEPWRQLDIANDMIDVITSSRVDIEESFRRGEVIEDDNLLFLAPIQRPGKIVCIGQNYWDHVREQNAKVPEKPIIFAKFPSTIVGPNSVIKWDPALTAQVDYEAELAVIIGQEARNVSAESALRHVFGYTCANDVSARDLQFGDGQWVRGKSLDTFCPLGPVIADTDVITDPQNVGIRCEVNGTVLQDSNTKEMIFDVRTIISYASRAFTLNPGDIILTGTPAGVGVFRDPKILLKDGDSVVVELEHIGRLENTCREASEGVV
jgi:2-keto-4-pentenoate hydratase/2-oxohepta-3-ene-1,7-dioic acid hydratase in catechol pathway